MSMETPYSPTYIDERISNKQRRALRGKPNGRRLAEARQSQSESGLRIRIARPVKNASDFGAQMRVWHDLVRTGKAKRKTYGQLALTVFDTKQQPLRNGLDHSEETLTELFEDQYPDLFRDTKPAAVTGTNLFGSKSEPFVGLVFAPGRIHDERIIVRDIVAPELSLGDGHEKLHRPHVSLGRTSLGHLAVEMQQKLEPVLPAYVQFGPATIYISRTG